MVTSTSPLVGAKGTRSAGTDSAADGPGDVVDDVVVGTAEPADIELDHESASPVSFTDVYERQFLPLVRLATLMTNRPEIARDVVQDAFVKLHVKWDTVRNPDAYVRRSVVNGVRSRYRKRARHPVVPLTSHDQATPFDVDHTLATLERLTHRERSCVVLKYYADLTEREIADAVGCRPGSVGPTLQRALAKLRDAQDVPPESHIDPTDRAH